MSQRTLKAAPIKPTGRVYEFGPYYLNPAERVLLRNGEPVALTPKAFETLVVLVRNGGHLVAKEELMQEVWPDTFVEEANLTQHVSMLRKALGEGTEEQHYIETVPRQGYRFVASVRQVLDEGADLTAHRRNASSIIAVPESETDAPEDIVGIEQATEPKTRAVLSWANRGARRRLKTILLAALILLVGIAIGVFYFWIDSQPQRPQTTATARTIAILPFKPIGPEGDDEYLGLGMADALITKLSNIKEIIVRPTSSVSKYTGGQQDAVAAGRELGVDSVLDGSIQKVNGQVRITVRLIQIKDAAPLWAETFDEKWTDVFSVQSSIAEKVAVALTPKLTGEARSLLVKDYTKNTEAYQLYLKGKYSANKWTEEGFKKSIEFFNQAIAIDPDYALAYAGLANTYFGLSLTSESPKEMLPEMKKLAQKAVALDKFLGEAHASLAMALATYDWDWAGAEKECREALELNPNNAQFHLVYADLLSTLGRFDEALSEYKMAQEMDPTSSVINASVAYHFLRARDFDQAIEKSQKALELDRAHKPLGALGWAYLYKGEPGKALEMFQKYLALEGSNVTALEGIGRSYAAMGDRGQALKITDELKEMSQHQYVPSLSIATIYLQLGEKDQAIEFLEKAYEERSPNLVILKTDQQFDPLRADPRFIKLMQRIGFEP